MTERRYARLKHGHHPLVIENPPNKFTVDIDTTWGGLFVTGNDVPNTDFALFLDTGSTYFVDYSSTMASSNPVATDTFNAYVDFVSQAPVYQTLAEIGFFGDSLFQVGSGVQDGDVSLYITQDSPTGWKYPLQVDNSADCIWIQGGFNLCIGSGAGTWSAPGDIVNPTQYVTFAHDGIDLNVTGTSTTDINITGIAGFNVGNYNFDVDQTVGAGQDNYVLTYDNASGLISLEAASGGGLASGTVTSGSLRWSGTDWVEEDRVRITASGEVVFYDATLADTLTISHDGNHAQFACVTTTDINFDGYSGAMRLRGTGGGLYIYDSDDTASLQLLGHDTSSTITNTGTVLTIDSGTEIRIGNGTEFYVRGGGVRFYDSTVLDYVEFIHDGTDLNFNHSGTTDWNINSVTNVNIGTDVVAKSSATTGGTGSAGAGNQYVELNIGGTIYKVLHDGTV